MTALNYATGEFKCKATWTLHLYSDSYTLFHFLFHAFLIYLIDIRDQPKAWTQITMPFWVYVYWKFINRLNYQCWGLECLLDNFFVNCLGRKTEKFKGIILTKLDDKVYFFEKNFPNNGRAPRSKKRRDKFFPWCTGVNDSGQTGKQKRKWNWRHLPKEEPLICEIIECPKTFLSATSQQKKRTRSFVSNERFLDLRQAAAQQAKTGKRH